MAPSIPSSRWMLTTLPIAVILFHYLWSKRKKVGVQSDPGGTNTTESNISVKPKASEPLSIRSDNKIEPVQEKVIAKSLTRAESLPIDIPREQRSNRSNPLHISDEDLDDHIEKIRSMKNSNDVYTISKQAEKRIEEPAAMSPLKSQFVPVESGPTKKKGNKNNKKGKKSNTENKNLNGECSRGKENCTQSCSKSTDHSPVEAVEIESIKMMEEPTCKPSTSLNAESKEFTPKSYEGAKLLETEFRPIKTEEEKSSRSDNVQKQGGESSCDERDSANHSPADAMLASPSLSNISDNHSEGSNDSGKGCSEVATSPSRTPAVADIQDNRSPGSTIFDFIIPQQLVGKLIGHKGNTINDIKAKSNTHILVKMHPDNRKVKLCVIEGTQKCIDRALKLIRDKFPLKKYPDVTLTQCYLAMPAFQLNPDSLYVSKIVYYSALQPTLDPNFYLRLRLVEGIDNDTVMSCIVKPNYLFLQQHTHPTYMALKKMADAMNADYSSPNSPRVPFPVPESSVCVGFANGQWSRIMILNNIVEEQKAFITYLDYGGFTILDYSDLRQIRGDYLRLPFQAQGAILSSIKPLGGQEWAPEAFDLVSEIAFGRMLYTRVDGFTSWGEPIVHVYAVQPDKKCRYLNKELVDRGYAEWAAVQFEHPLWWACHSDNLHQMPVEYNGEVNEVVEEDAVGYVIPEVSSAENCENTVCQDTDAVQHAQSISTEGAVGETVACIATD